MAVYFNYSFQNYNYQMPSFHFLQIRGLSCWTWHHEKAKNFTRIIFCLSDKWISLDFFFPWLLPPLPPPQDSVIFYVPITMNRFAVAMLLKPTRRHLCDCKILALFSVALWPSIDRLSGKNPHLQAQSFHFHWMVVTITKALSHPQSH